MREGLTLVGHEACSCHTTLSTIWQRKMPRLTPEQKRFYKDNGFIKLDDVFSSEEMDEICQEYDFIFQSKCNQGMEAAWEGDDMKKQANFINYSVKSVHNMQFHSAVFSRVLMKKGLLDALEDVMGTENIALHHTKAHLKPPENGAPYLMHQDYHYFPYRKHSMVAAFLHLDDSSPENGGLAVYPGSHLRGPQEDRGVTEKGEEYHYLDQKMFPLEGATPIRAARGSVVIFSYLLVHGSYLNLSARPRRMFLAQLVDPEDEPLRDTHRSPGQGWMLRGRNLCREATMAKRFEA